MGGMELIKNALNNTDFRLQESAAFVLGSAVSRYDCKNIETLQLWIVLLNAHDNQEFSYGLVIVFSFQQPICPSCGFRVWHLTQAVDDACSRTTNVRKEKGNNSW